MGMTKQEITAIISNSCPHCIRAAKDFGVDKVNATTDEIKTGKHGSIRFVSDRSAIESENLLKYTRHGVPAFVVKREEEYYPFSVGYSNKDDLLKKANLPTSELSQAK